MLPFDVRRPFFYFGILRRRRPRGNMLLGGGRGQGLSSAEAKRSKSNCKSIDSVGQQKLSRWIKTLKKLFFRFWNRKRIDNRCSGTSQVGLPPSQNQRIWVLNHWLINLWFIKRWNFRSGCVDLRRIVFAKKYRISSSFVPWAKLQTKVSFIGQHSSQATNTLTLS